MLRKPYLSWVKIISGVLVVKAMECQIAADGQAYAAIFIAICAVFIGARCQKDLKIRVF